MKALHWASLAGGVLVVAGAAFIAIAEDTITIVDAGGAPLSDATVFATGNRMGGCFCYVGTGSSLGVGNVTPGPSQVAALSKNHALHFAPNVSWTYQPTDKYKATLDPLLEVPVKVWKLIPDAPQISRDLAFAKRQLLDQETGLSLQETVRDATGIADFSNAGCQDIKALAKHNLYDPDAINVYYADVCGIDCAEVGKSCRADPRVNFVYEDSTESTLLHEVGHSLLGNQGVDHWDRSISSDNIMRDSVATIRATVSLGQAVTMNYEASSVLLTLKRRTIGLRCSTDCPAIEFDDSWATCSPPDSRYPPAPLPAVDDWFDCIECTGGQLDRVVNEARFDDQMFGRLRNILLPPPGRVQDSPLIGDENGPFRRQRRAVIALKSLAIRGHEAAKLTIEQANALPAGSFRDEVRKAVAAAYAATR
jgi:hypothetical protein